MSFAGDGAGGVAGEDGDRPRRGEPGPLERIVAGMIREQGAIDVASYTTLCLGHPRHGFYKTARPLGASGHFVTAPEISQLFGELMGLSLAQAWLDAGSPAPTLLVEAGPGRGTLLADLLRATAKVPGFHAALRTHLIEANPDLRAAQEATLRRVAPGVPYAWHERLADVPEEAPLLFVANEFLDVLPPRQYLRTHDGWRERLVGLDGAGGLEFQQSPKVLPGSVGVSPAKAKALPGQVVEVSPARESFAAELAAKLKAQGGVALLVDYGEADLPPGDTFQAVRDHRKVHPLDGPGSADLTSRVDFNPLLAQAAAAGLSAYGPVPQGVFLQRLGLAARLQRLSSAHPERRGELTAGAVRLTDPSQMGELFKTVAFSSYPSPPPGFVPEDAFRGARGDD